MGHLIMKALKLKSAAGDKVIWGETHFDWHLQAFTSIAMSVTPTIFDDEITIEKIKESVFTNKDLVDLWELVDVAITPIPNFAP